MCEVCGSTHCVSSCPNYMPKVIGRCEKCGEHIYDNGAIWIDDNNNKFCSEECAEEYYGIKEMDD